MKIAVATNGHTLEHTVAEKFEKSTHLLVVEMDDWSFEVYSKDSFPPPAELALVEIIIAKDCEAIITGSMERPSFEALAEQQITRYNGANYSARDALNLMEEYRLDYITTYEGELPMLHFHSSCGGHEHGEED
ncbi:MAG: hypothetical protein GX091_02085 [Peptococcaceae bacterium]|nr:hypothetical protein [Peptococcaceae bacterium]